MLSLSQGLPPALTLPVTIVEVERGTVRVIKSVVPKNITHCPRPCRAQPGPLNPETSTLTMIHQASHNRSSGNL